MHEGSVPGLARLTRDGAAPGERSAAASGEPGGAVEPGAVDAEPGAAGGAGPGDPPTLLIADPVSGPLPSLVLLHHIATGAALEIAQLTADQDRQRRLG